MDQRLLFYSVDAPGKSGVTGAKEILKDKTVLAYVLKGCVPDYKGQSIADIRDKYIQGEIYDTATRPEELPEKLAEFGEAKLRTDILFLAASPAGDGEFGIVINVETQNRREPFLVQAEYAANLPSLNWGGQSLKMKKVYSIWIFLEAEEGYRNSVRQARVQWRMTRDGENWEEQDDISPAKVVAVNLDREKIDNEHDILKCLNTIFTGTLSVEETAAVLHEEFGIDVAHALIEKAKDDKALFYEDGFAKGYDKGATLERRRCVTQLMQSTGWSLAACLKQLGIPDGDWEKCLYLY
jgi:hypothetical protein